MLRRDPVTRRLRWIVRPESGRKHVNKPGQPLVLKLMPNLRQPLIGRVLDKAGQPIAGAEVLSMSTNVSNSIGSRPTDAQGNFEFRAIWPEADVRLLVRADGYASVTRNVPLKDDQYAPQEIRLEVADGTVQGWLGGACSALAFALTPFTTRPLALGALSALNGVGWSVATTAQLALLQIPGAAQRRDPGAAEATSGQPAQQRPICVGWVDHWVWLPAS